MTTYTGIPNSDIDQDSPVTQPLLTSLRDNLLAAMEGDPTAVAAGVTLKDPALDTGAATAAGIAWVGLRTAGLAVGAVGSYAFMLQSTGVAQGPGVTFSGAGLVYASAAGAGSTAPAGTWRQMGRTTGAGGAASTTLFLRIS